jgi:uncharacterized protein (UPF0248 family)
MYLVRHPKILAIPFEIFTKDHIQALDVFEGMFPEFAPYRKESVLSEEIIKKIEDVRGMEKNPEAYVATSSVPRRIELEYYTKAREAIYRQIEEIPSVALAVERASIPYRRLVERFSVLVEKYKN